MEKETKWLLLCLLCGLDETQDAIKDDVRTKGHLVAMQEHAMCAHGVKQTDFARQSREEIVPGEFYRWTLPDGRIWLEADTPATFEDLRPVRIEVGKTSPVCKTCRMKQSVMIISDRRPGRDRKGHVYLCDPCFRKAVGLK